MLKIRSALNEATREINAAETEMPPSALIELMGEAPDVEAILATLPADAYLPKEEPEEAPAEETTEEVADPAEEAPAEEAPAEAAAEEPAAEAAEEAPAEEPAEEPAAE